ncbi:MAG TPA: hypothetical protein PL110_06760 [Candidatus Eremiobacteraeota bacterium]|nr:hypothetical protein [Candidatus Eremiobacteraeota bacterium]
MYTYNWTKEDQKLQNKKLEEVIEIIKEKTRKQISTLAIFDLDGTLFDNRTRTIFILREISEQFDRELPELSEAMDKFHELSVVEYNPVGTLKRIGVRSEEEIAFIEKEWAKRFFSDEYQKFDFPMSGGKSYVTRVHEAGATVIYLTGRDVGRMLVGTTDCLRLYGFPVGIVGTMILVKEDVAVEDEIFKVEVVDYLKRLGSVVAVFENEPLNSNLLHKAFPEALSFLVMTQHRPDSPEAVSEIFKIKDFKIR